MPLMPIRLNVGCGPTPTSGWINLDNSPSIILSRAPDFFLRLLSGVGFLNPDQLHLVHTARRSGIIRATATRLPFEPATVDVVYSSHMLEHLDRGRSRQFLLEAHRVIRPGGWLRIVVPDLERPVREYTSSGDADALIERLLLAMPKAYGRHAVVQRLVGFRGHRWMYDSRSLARLIESCGFCNVDIVEPGETHVPDPGELDLREREDESIYAEAQKPKSPGDASIIRV
jgi:predicted SAM-dependent methyltransferase